jgi:hypothetical protein
MLVFGRIACYRGLSDRTPAGLDPSGDAPQNATRFLYALG